MTTIEGETPNFILELLRILLWIQRHLTGERKSDQSVRRERTVIANVMLQNIPIYKKSLLSVESTRGLTAFAQLGKRKDKVEIKAVGRAER